MSLLLVQSCSKSKIQTTDPVPALELYSGYYYKIIKKAIREGDFDPEVDLRILSAEHGLIDPDTRLRTYDRRMDAARAEELRNEVVATLQREVQAGTYDRIVINMGQTYRAAIHGLSEAVAAPVTVLRGKLGERGQQLKQLIRPSLSEGRTPEEVAQ